MWLKTSKIIHAIREVLESKNRNVSKENEKRRTSENKETGRGKGK